MSNCDCADCAARRPASLLSRLRAYSPENRAHVVHEAADCIENLCGTLSELIAAWDANNTDAAMKYPGTARELDAWTAARTALAKASP